MAATKFLHTADWQLGMRRHFLDDDAQPRFLQSRIDAIRTMAALATDEGCEFAVVAGDVWDSNALDRRTVRRSLEALGEFDCPVYVLPGNHDPFDAASIYRSAPFEQNRPDGVQVLDSHAPLEVAPGIEIVAAPWPTKRPNRDLVAEALAELEAADGVLRICVAHGIVDEGAPDQDDPALISKANIDTALAEDRVHFVALGDRHSVTGLAERIWYSGAPEATDYGEADSGKALVVELDGDDCRVVPHEVGRWRFVRETLEFTSGDDVDTARRWIEELPSKEYTILKLSLQGSLGLADKAKLDVVLDGAREVYAALEIWSRHTNLVLVPDSLDVDELGLAGFAQSTVEELEQLATTEGEGAVTAGDALSLLYRLATGVGQ